MTNDPTDRGENPELLSLRQEIDAIDDQLIDLLTTRIGIVSRVGELKRRIAPGRCPIRPGREASMVRRIMAAFEHTPFLPVAAAAIWRTIIGMSTTTEAPLTLSVYVHDRDSDLYWMGREYFGSFCPTIKQPHIKRVIGDVMDGKAAVGIVPMLRAGDTSYWWTNLTGQGKDIPKIFARLPFVSHDAPARGAVSALAFACIEPEPTEDDNSLIVLEADHNVSQHRLQTAFVTAKLEATWIDIATLHPNSRHHLIELRGFVPPEHPSMQAFLSALGTSVLNLSFLGAYAVPHVSNVSDNKATHHASGLKQTTTA